MAKAVVIAGSKSRGKGRGKGHSNRAVVMAVAKAELYNTYITETSFPYITETSFCGVRFNIFSWWPIRSLEKKKQSPCFEG